MAGTTNVLMAGVGGQGTLVGSETLALAALAEGLETKQSEVHGVAQRGGSVVSHVRFGERVHSPLIRCGDVDVLYAAERLEALRYAHYVKDGGAVVMDITVNPMAADVSFALSGFSYHEIRDESPAGIVARAVHLERIVRWLHNILPVPTGAGTPGMAVNELRQN